MAGTMIARQVLVTGKVQGVYFREWAVKTAQELEVDGWVRNRRDGYVEVYAVGAGAAVERFIERLRDGSPASEVDQVIAEQAPVEKMRSFVRRQTV